MGKFPGFFCDEKRLEGQSWLNFLMFNIFCFFCGEKRWEWPEFA
jgi:hypothetical protein